MTDRNRQVVYTAIDEERDRQDNKFGNQSGNAWFKWLAILTEEVGEVAQVMLQLHEAKEPAIIEQRIIQLRRELTQVAAVSVACLELTAGWEKPQ